MYCQKCGQYLPDNAQHCIVCGAPTADGSVPTPPAAPYVTPPPVMQPPAAPYITPPPPVTPPPVTPPPAYEMPAYAPPVSNAPIGDSPASTPVYNAPIYVPSPSDGHPAPSAASSKNPGKVFGTLSLVLGIVGLAGSTILSCVISYFSSVSGSTFAIAGLIFGIIGLSKAKGANQKNPCALVGLILSIVALVLGVILSIVSYLLYFALP